MIIKQLTVFLENEAGRINAVASTLGKNGINMSAFSMAESAEFGILRVIVNDPAKAQEVLRTERFAVSLTDVVCVSCANSPGSLSEVLEVLAHENVFIEYMYAFSTDSTANVIIRPNEIEKCIKVLEQHDIELINANEFYK